MPQMHVGVLLQVLENNQRQRTEVRHFHKTHIVVSPRHKTGTMIRILSFDANAPPEVYKNKTEIKVEIQK